MCSQEPDVHNFNQDYPYASGISLVIIFVTQRISEGITMMKGTLSLLPGFREPDKISTDWRYHLAQLLIICRPNDGLLKRFMKIPLKVSSSDGK